jgi:hypothetical protein
VMHIEMNKGKNMKQKKKNERKKEKNSKII